MKRKKQVCAELLAIALMIACGGCTSMVLEHAAAGYSEAYADAVNSQMLLNLARLSHNEPAHFIQLGSFTANYRFNAGAAFSPQTQRQTANGGSAIAGAVVKTLTLGGGVTAGAEESPSFQFLPLSGSIFTKAVYTPIDPKIFLSLLDQNYPGDSMVRLLVAEVTVTDPANTNHVEVYVNHPRDPTYGKFLNFSYDFNRLTLSRAVKVKQLDRIVSIATFNDPKLNDILAAAAAGYELSEAVRPGTNSYALTKKRAEAVLSYNPAWSNEYHVGTAAPEFQKDQIQQLLAYYGITAEDDLLRRFSFKFRTFESVMYFAAQEEGWFQKNAQDDAASSVTKYRGPDANGYSVVLLGKPDMKGRAFVFRPLLSLTAPRRNVAELIGLRYKGQRYVIGDNASREFDDAPWHNQDRIVFTVLCYLFAQVTIDTEKLPVQQVIQAR